MELTKVIVTIVGKDGRITIPSDIRKEHDIQEGDIVKFVSYGQGQDLKFGIIHAEK